MLTSLAEKKIRQYFLFSLNLKSFSSVQDHTVVILAGILLF